MAFQRPTLKDLVARIGADFDGWLSGSAAKLKVAVVNVLARVHAGIAHGLYGFIAWVARQILPDTAEKAYLERHASLWGITRVGAATATGTATVATTTLGAVIKAGAVLRRGDGVQFAVTEDVTVTGTTTPLPIACTVPGATANTETAVVLSMVQPVEGVATKATVVTVDGGADAESDLSLFTRLDARRKSPPHGGAMHDYVAWTKSVIGDGKVWVKSWVDHPALAPGTVIVRFILPDGTLPDAETVAAVAARIETSPDADYPENCRPVTAKVLVAAPVAAPLAIEISGLNPGNLTVKAAVEAEIADLIFREAEPGGTLLISHIREAVSTAAGEYDHVLVEPTANVTVLAGEITTFDGVVWS
ncbi:MAG: baseplate J/gp47 family protein [Rhodospirillum sp.]|nr:baseplate J/gp47 family protein [Rhodospirillum sp.]MCF8500172.1 baseplate J/gp47 family protein [Rhodospirillum sp.]